MTKMVCDAKMPRRDWRLIMTNPSPSAPPQPVPVPKVPRKTKADVIKCHACHAKRRLDVTKCHAYHAKCRGVHRRLKRAQARHQSQPSAISARPATRKVPPASTATKTRPQARHQMSSSAICATSATRNAWWMSPSATPALQNQGRLSPSATPATRKMPWRHRRPKPPHVCDQIQPSAIYAMRATQNACDAGGQMVVDKVTKCVCERWCVDKDVCERWCVDKDVCDRWWLTKMCVKDSV